jgi:hypothetical protein
MHAWQQGLVIHSGAVDGHNNKHSRAESRPHVKIPKRSMLPSPQHLDPHRMRKGPLIVMKAERGEITEVLLVRIQAAVSGLVIMAADLAPCLGVCGRVRRVVCHSMSPQAQLGSVRGAQAAAVAEAEVTY